jgi:hypothetical protein
MIEINHTEKPKKSISKQIKIIGSKKSISNTPVLNNLSIPLVFNQQTKALD